MSLKGSVILTLDFDQGNIRFDIWLIDGIYFCWKRIFIVDFKLDVQQSQFYLTHGKDDYLNKVLSDHFNFGCQGCGVSIGCS